MAATAAAGAAAAASLLRPCPAAAAAPGPASSARSALVHRSGCGLAAGCVTGSSVSPFGGQCRQLLLRSKQAAPATRAARTVPVMAGEAAIQFIRGIDELTVPDVKLTRSRDGSNGTATFSFDQPSVFDSSRELGDITGLYLVDEEGIIQSVNVSAKFVNGKPSRIEARHVMKNTRDWDRFMRFMERYAEKNNLGFFKK